MTEREQKRKEEEEDEVNRLTHIVTHKVDLVDKPANKRPFLIVKRDDSEPEDKQGDLAPSDDMNDEKLRELQAQRSEHYGIEVLDEAALTFPKDFPTSLDEYGDPVSLKYPIDSEDRAANARVRFKQFANEYAEEASRAVVHERIIRAELSFDIEPSFDPKDDLDALLPKDLKDQLMANEEESTKEKAEAMTRAVREDIADQIRQLHWGVNEIEWGLEMCGSVDGAAVPEKISEAIEQLLVDFDEMAKKYGGETAPAEDEQAPESEEEDEPEPAAAAEEEDEEEPEEMAAPEGKSDPTAKRVVIPWEDAEDFEIDPAKREELRGMLRMVRAKLMHAEAALLEAPEEAPEKAPPDVQGMVAEARDVLSGGMAVKTEEAKAMKSIVEIAAMMAEALESMEDGKAVEAEQLSGLQAAHAALVEYADAEERKEEPAEDELEAGAEDDSEQEPEEMAAPTAKAGKKQLSAGRAKQFRKAIAALVKLLEDMDPGLTKEDLWPERENEEAAAEEEEPEEKAKSAPDEALTARVSELESALETSKAAENELRAKIDKASRTVPPSNVTTTETAKSTAKAKSNGKEDRVVLPLDLNDPEFLAENG